MPKFTCDGTTLEIEDSGTLSILKQWIEARDATIADLQKRFDGKYKKFGEDMKEYTDMSEMYEDLKKYYDMCQEAKKAKKNADARVDALELEAAKRTDSPDDFEAQVQAAVKERRKLEQLASRIDGFDVTVFDTMPNIEIKRAIVRHDGLESDGYDEDQLDIVLTVLTRNDTQKKAKYQEQRSLFTNTTSTKQRKDGMESEPKWITDNIATIENAWKGGEE